MDFIKSHKFIPHPEGNKSLFGLNNFGCDSTISYTEIDGSVDIWRFIKFASGSSSVRDAIYINKLGDVRNFDLMDKNIASRAVRLEEC
jgi:hypothetical protein